MSKKKLGLDPATWSYRFKFEGHIYTLIKRNPTKDGAYWLRMIQDGKPVVRSLDTNIAATAEQRAVEKFIKPAKAGQWAVIAPPKAPTEYARLGAVLACYQELCVGRTPPLTVRNNRNSFRLLVRRGKGDDGMTDAAVDALPASVLTGTLVSDFEDWMARQAVAQGRELQSNKRTVTSYLRHARSLFKRSVLPRYAEKGVKLPDVSGFMQRAVERAHTVEPLPPSDELVKATLDAVPALRAADRPAYIAWLLGLSSLRRGEIGKMKWDWLQKVNNNPVIRLPGNQQKGKLDKLVPIDSRVAQELEDYKPQRVLGLNPEEETYVLPSPNLGQGGPHCRLRAQNVFKRVNKWMRSLGWTTNHTLHEMRRLAGILFMRQHGLDKTQPFMRHADRRTTQNSYVGMEAIEGITIDLPLQIGEAV